VIQRRYLIGLLVLAFGVPGCRSKHRQTPPEGSPDVLVPLPASARAAGDGASPDAGKDCAARKQIKAYKGFHRPVGQIFAGDGIDGLCLGDPVEPDVITYYDCKPRGQWRLCRQKPGPDLYYDKNWRLDVIRVNGDTRGWRQPTWRTARTPDGFLPGQSPDDVTWFWGMPLRTERVHDPDFGLVEVRYYPGIALEIERPPRRAPVIAGIYVFAMDRSPCLGPLAPATEDGGMKHGK
jgi:hypothetical protein